MNRSHFIIKKCLIVLLFPMKYRKILKIFPGLIFFKGPFWGAYIRRGLSTQGSLYFKIDWASLIFGSKFTVFALFYFVFEGHFPSASPQGAYIWRGDLTEGFFALPVWGAYIFGGAYTMYMDGLIFGILKYVKFAVHHTLKCWKISNYR